MSIDSQIKLSRHILTFQNKKVIEFLINFMKTLIPLVAKFCGVFFLFTPHTKQADKVLLVFPRVNRPGIVANSSSVTPTTSFYQGVLNFACVLV